MQIIRPKYLLRPFLPGLLLFAAGCDAACGRDCIAPPSLEEHLREGDLLFRRGIGIAGATVRALDRGGRYSHVGVAVRSDSGWMVVHAVPSEPDFDGDIDRVKCEPVDRFYSGFRASAGCIMRLRDTLNSAAPARAAREALRLSRLRVPFDHEYAWEDTTRLYCTQLVAYVYSLSSVDLAEDRRTRCTLTGLAGDYVFPSDVAQSPLLTLIHSF